MLRIASKKCTAIQVQVKQTFRGGLKMSEVIIIGHDGTFATRLRKLMEEHHTTQKELAEKVGISRQAISQYADGSVQPNIEKFYKIKEYFKVSADYLLGKTNSESTEIDDIAISNKLGLSDGAIHTIKKIKERELNWGINYFNYFVSAKRFTGLFISIRQYMIDAVSEHEFEENFFKKYVKENNLCINEEELSIYGVKTLDLDNSIEFFESLKLEKRKWTANIGMLDKFDIKYDLYKIAEEIKDVLSDAIHENYEELLLIDDIQKNIMFFNCETEEDYMEADAIQSEIYLNQFLESSESQD